MLSLDNSCIDSISNQLILDIANVFDIKRNKDDLRFAILKVHERINSGKTFRNIKTNDDMESFLCNYLIKFASSCINHPMINKSSQNYIIVKNILSILISKLYEKKVNERDRIKISNNSISILEYFKLYSKNLDCLKDEVISNERIIYC